ncbi:MAG: MarR family transcriptional regulator [Rhodospirillaceae bacterium]|nr:MarR family transcriptional regulator [Rhodospirillaceae bacterium]
MPKPFYDTDSFDGGRSIGYLIRRCHAKMMPQVEARFVDAELTFSQWVVLMSLRDKAAGTCADIARNMNHDTGAVTRLVDQLEKRGLVARTRSTSDRRVVHLKLLPAGKKMAKALIPRIVDFWNGVLADFSRAEAARLIKLLTRLDQRLDGPSMPAAKRKKANL